MKDRDWERFDRNTREYHEEWESLDRPLYDLCKQHPNHSTAAAVHAKLWIIGRTYGTGIERQIESGHRWEGESLLRLSKHILSHSSDLDSIFRQLHGVMEPLDPEKLKMILGVHGRFLVFLKPVIRTGLTPHAFAAKYLHFHCPAVPIYDSVAVEAIRHFVPWRDELTVFQMPRGADQEYAWFVFRFWSLYKEGRDKGREITVKLLDNFLLSQAY